jgi:hypothetical protein
VKSPIWLKIFLKILDDLLDIFAKFENFLPIRKNLKNRGSFNEKKG